MDQDYVELAIVVWLFLFFAGMVFGLLFGIIG